MSEKWHSYATAGKWWDKLKPLAREHRHEPTRAEFILWSNLRGRKLSDFKFRRQYAIERFIVDFICPMSRLIVEVDGEIHQYTVEEDSLRQVFLESLGYRVIRFTNDDVFTAIDAVLHSISAACLQNSSHNSYNSE